MFRAQRLENPWDRAMGQRMSPPPMPQEDGSWEDVEGGCTPPVPSSEATRIVKRIADALGLSPAVLYDAPASGDTPSGIDADAVTADSGLDCA